ncbi:HNH endonuclease signature motif containing protein [Allobranchiibius sp. CTAmp26]|uniref:HNH endonuclease n=1 Tax=Allobranchiibius sp. CTAmp26 TaxID=2815214 RepID=UPI001AA177E0|nr:HNH endonuclease signature motif containing protein [Allobranchiibius sp. CTAmp26]MBO1755757.1 DUF222 domain-containing protein [Allobranchiibius sp. CTAmp26]
MFDPQQTIDPESSSPLSSSEIRAWLVRLLGVDYCLSGAERIDQIAALEHLKGAAAAAQATLTVDHYDEQRAADQSRGIRQADTARSVGGEVALARRESPSRGSRHLGLARALVDEMPHTYGALRRGEISEWRAAIVTQETACTTRQIRGIVDEQLAPDLARFSDRRAHAMAAGLTAQQDAASVVARRSRAVASRRVSVRPAPDGMAILTAVLPCADAIAAHLALQHQVDRDTTDRAHGSRGQRMADLFVALLTGRETAGPCDVRLNLVMDTETLFAGGSTPARLEGYGSIPADLARQLVGAKSGPDLNDARVTLRRLFTSPGEGDLVQMETTARAFTGLLRELVTVRDEVCRTPYCDAPIRHIDHIQSHATGGPTSYANAQGLCEQCNYRKEHPGWHAARAPGDGYRHGVHTITPTGHVYRSEPPPSPTRHRSRLEHALAKRIDVAPLSGDLCLEYG